MPYEPLEQAGRGVADAIDRRRSTREERMVSAWLSDASGKSMASTQQQVLVTNLSLHGVGFQAKKPISRDDQHWIVIAADSMHLSTRLRVVSVREQPEGTYEVGAEFF